MTNSNQLSEAPPSGDAFRQDENLSTLSSYLQDGALFLDIDGTLLDLAPTPDEISVPPSLPAQLNALSQKLGGALALVTGRGLSYADRLFAPFQFPIAGLHGAERRTSDGNIFKVEPTAEFERLKIELRAETAGWSGILIEDKGAAVAAHFRLAPARQAELAELMQRLANRAGPDWTLQQGKMVFEIRPARANKGDALESFLAVPPFNGRHPIAIGDDLTDEAMFGVANQHGGYSIRVGPASAATAARGTLPSPETVRKIIAYFAS
ncbi:trehalose 6-phosphate phosphatase [Rhizobium sp. BK650]|uniref:trehalose-phosphatase n=1 Tax=Rhizobium sp. BK650 TaxID=2586990 RepID=UPI001619B412|nr:trehalose-phosphatase [Rhizobium sp. BK650]MBB3655960.1 trehalose 6-phosphate phosphatase [Rhizobium sp. BK650]